MGCRLRAAGEWAVRGMHELQMHGGIGEFGTFTYDQDCVPRSGSLSKLDLQLFHKRLRHHFGPFRYLACGEYGEEGRRPHYHGVYFGLDVPDKVPFSRSKSGELQYRSETLTSIWGHGEVLLGTVTFQSVGYVARYTTKKVNGERLSEALHRFDGSTGESWQVEPEFMVSSRKPGLGRAWFNRYADDAFPSDFVVVDGRRMPVPAYYTTLLAEREAMKLKRARKDQRRKAMQLRPDEQLDRRLMVKHTSKLLKAKLLKRDG